MTTGKQEPAAADEVRRVGASGRRLYRGKAAAPIEEVVCRR